MDKERKIQSMKPYVEKLIIYLNNNGIDFYWKDGDNDNVVLTKENKVKKISYHCFYRYSGLSSFFNEMPDKTHEWVKVTDDLYINSYMRSIIDFVFGLK